MKSVFALLGIRGFNLKLKRAAERLQSLRTPEGEPIPPHAIAALKRDMERRQLIRDQIRQIEQTRLERLQLSSKTGPHAMVCLLARVVGLGVGTADMLAHEVFARNMRDRRALARYSGLTGSPNESGAKRREKGLSRSGNARVRRGMIELAWRFLRFQKDSALAQWFRTRTENAHSTRKTMIMAMKMSHNIRLPACSISPKFWERSRWRGPDARRGFHAERENGYKVAARLTRARERAGSPQMPDFQKTSPMNMSGRIVRLD